MLLQHQFGEIFVQAHDELDFDYWPFRQLAKCNFIELRLESGP